MHLSNHETNKLIKICNYYKICTIVINFIMKIPNYVIRLKCKLLKNIRVYIFYDNNFWPPHEVVVK
jgi:hypothetical protein